MKKLRQAIDNFNANLVTYVRFVHEAVGNAAFWVPFLLFLAAMIVAITLDAALEDLGRCIAFRRDCF